MRRDDLEAIEAALRTILGSRGFKGSERMCRFLSFAVEHALRADPAPLKEYEIGLRVFDRGEDFDPRQDPIVRVEARRLRAKLKEYYDTEGADAPVVIEFPDRGYLPSFRPRQPAGRRGRRKLVLAGAGICLAGITAAAVILWPNRTRPAPSIVVLPFLNLSPDPANEYVGDGFTEEITNALAAIPELRVVARTSAFHFKGRADDVQTIGQRLNAQWVLEGSIRKEADRLRVTVQLVDAGTRIHAWSHAYDASMAGLFEVQERIAGEICRALDIRLSSTKRGLVPSRAVKPEAYEAYLKGRYFWYRLTPEALRKSISYLNQAVQLDPTYAAAHAALADSYSVLPQFELEPQGELLDKCRSAAERALALDGDSAEAHFAAGVARAIADGDPAGAERSFLRALELKPNLTAARQAYAVCSLSNLGRHAQAVTELRRVIADDPVSSLARALLGRELALAGHPNEAVRELQQSFELEPGSVFASLELAQIYIAQSRYLEARNELERTPEPGKSLPVHAGLLGYTYGRLGDRTGAERMLQQLTSRPYVPPVEVAGIYNGLGQTDEALKWLDRGYQERSLMLVIVTQDDRFASLRRNPSFPTLVKRMGLASPRSPQPAVK